MNSPGQYGFSDYALLTPSFVPMNLTNGVFVASPSAYASDAPNLMNRLAFPSPSYSPKFAQGALLPSGLPPLLVTDSTEVEQLKKENAELTKRLAQFENEYSREHSREQNAEREEDARLEELRNEIKELRRDKQLQEQALQQLFSQQQQLCALIDRQIEAVKAELRRTPQQEHLFTNTGQKLQAALFYNDLLKTSPQQLKYLLQQSKHRTAQDAPQIAPSLAFVPAPYRDDANEEDYLEDVKIAVSDQLDETDDPNTSHVPYHVQANNRYKDLE